MSDKFAAEAYRAYVADTASELELKSIDISGMTAEEIYHQMVLLVPYFLSRKLDCVLILECANSNGGTCYYKIKLSASYDYSGKNRIYGRLDYKFDLIDGITSYTVVIDEYEASEYMILGIETLGNIYTFKKLWYR